ncbi:hypothetical protein NGRA_0194 [Nosema granulosis]|uniref:Uncharacterized protein n=1 Tax=Nosema granulosis TaxID=83296 RepID=A0A9P6H0S2_9MICR|nr:hypothetical protein NGRA_0194 [Nosema granulosis]
MWCSILTNEGTEKIDTNNIELNTTAYGVKRKTSKDTLTDNVDFTIKRQKKVGENEILKFNLNEKLKTEIILNFENKNAPILSPSHLKSKSVKYSELENSKKVNLLEAQNSFTESSLNEETGNFSQLGSKNEEQRNALTKNKEEKQISKELSEKNQTIETPDNIFLDIFKKSPNVDFTLHSTCSLPQKELFFILYSRLIDLRDKLKNENAICGFEFSEVILELCKLKITPNLYRLRKIVKSFNGKTLFREIEWNKKEIICLIDGILNNIPKADTDITVFD